MKILTGEKRKEFEGWNYAHRGLHTADKSVPENSLAAFRRAAERGYGVELDVQLSKDGQVMVFHDDDLLRMTGKPGKIWDVDCEELRTLRLAGTGEKIPLFTEVLEVLQEGAGPLIVEVKTGPRNDELCEKTYEILGQYPGVWCMESFNPFVVNWFRKNAPEVVRGQLITNKEAYEGYPGFLQKFLARSGFAFLNRPHFIAFNLDAELPQNVRKMHEKGILTFGWTSRKAGNEKRADGLIFELYEPPVKNVF